MQQSGETTTGFSWTPIGVDANRRFIEVRLLQAVPHQLGYPEKTPNAKVTEVPANVVVPVPGCPYYVDNVNGGESVKTHAAKPRSRGL